MFFGQVDRIAIQQTQLWEWQTEHSTFFREECQHLLVRKLICSVAVVANREKMLKLHLSISVLRDVKRKVVVLNCSVWVEINVITVIPSFKETGCITPCCTILAEKGALSGWCTWQHWVFWEVFFFFGLIFCQHLKGIQNVTKHPERPKNITLNVQKKLVVGKKIWVKRHTFLWLLAVQVRLERRGNIFFYGSSKKDIQFI